MQHLQENDDELVVLSMKQAAQRLSLSLRTLWRLVSEDKIRLITLSERRRGVRSSELKRFIDSAEQQ